MNDLTIRGFVMRTYQEIEKEIAETRKHLSDLFKEQREVTDSAINIEKNKLYCFKDPFDKDIEYCGVIYDYWFHENSMIVQLCGVQKCLSDIQDSCWASFDVDHEISIHRDHIDKFIKNITEITRDEFIGYVDEWKQQVTEYLFNNVNEFLNS